MPRSKDKVFPKWNDEDVMASNILVDVVHAIHAIDDQCEWALAELKASVLLKMCKQHVDARNLPRIQKSDLNIGTILVPITFPGSTTDSRGTLVVRTLPEVGQNMLEIKVSPKENIDPKSWLDLELGELHRYVSEQVASQFEQWVEQKKKEIDSTFELNGHLA